MSKQKVLFTWSGGKDSAMALHELKKDHDYEIRALLTTVTEDYDRISMHGVRCVLLEQQATSLGLPLEKVLISKNSSNEEFESKMSSVLQKYKAEGISLVVFGDIFLEDLRKYREDNLSKIGLKAIFPIWKRNTTELAHSFITMGFKTRLTCIDSHVLDRSFAGRTFDEALLSELPSGVDPCGENGEFHSFTYDGPIFQKKISHTIGEFILRNDRFYYCDLCPEYTVTQTS